MTKKFRVLWISGYETIIRAVDYYIDDDKVIFVDAERNPIAVAWGDKINAIIIKK